MQWPVRAPRALGSHLGLDFIIAQALHTDARINGEGAQIGGKGLGRLSAQPDHQTVRDTALWLVARGGLREAAVAILNGKLRFAHASHADEL